MVRCSANRVRGWSGGQVTLASRSELVAASRKIDVLVQVVAKASASDRQEVGVAPLWRRMSPILHNRRKCAKSTKWAIYSTQSQCPLFKLPVSSSCGDSSGLKYAQRQGENTRRKCKSFGSINIFSIIMSDENMLDYVHSTRSSIFVLVAAFNGKIRQEIPMFYQLKPKFRLCKAGRYVH